MTFVNPSREKGVWFFARIAEELGRIRPDIPLLVVESRGIESTLVQCGLNLREHGNVFMMSHTHDPRKIWKRTKICVMPSLWWENQPLTAIEAMTNGIPVIASNRGGLPETLGSSGLVFPISERIRPDTMIIPESSEVLEWVDSIRKLWDDPEYFAMQSGLATSESLRWFTRTTVERYRDFFEILIAENR